MKTKHWVICQALAKEFKGIKAASDELGLFFASEEEARKYLWVIIGNIKRDIMTGKRKPNALNADEWLDFCIQEVEIDIPEEKMIKRGWTLPNRV